MALSTDSICLLNSQVKHTYGRDCENICNCAVEGEKCFVSTGNCPSGCQAGFFGQGCNKTCESGYFGIDCRNKCSSCSSLQCDRVNGRCTSCALKGKKLPYCTEDCDHGFYGAECRSNCSTTCSQNLNVSICDNIEGKCMGCKPGFYGANCTTSCPISCKDSVCDINTGNCLRCSAGFQGVRCLEDNDNNKLILGFIFLECSIYTYGEGCNMICGPNCNTNLNDSRVCDNVNGHCLDGCKCGYEGYDCSKPTSPSDCSGDYDKGLASGVGIGIGVTVFADVIIFIVVYFCTKRRKTPPAKPRDTTDRSYDCVDPIQQNEHPYYTVDKSGDGYDLVQDVVSFNKKTNSVVTEAGKNTNINTGCHSESS